MTIDTEERPAPEAAKGPNDQTKMTLHTIMALLENDHSPLTTAIRTIAANEVVKAELRVLRALAEADEQAKQEYVDSK